MSLLRNDLESAMPPFARLIRDVPDFPKPGVMFKDITPLLADPQGFAQAIEAMAAPWRERPPQAIAGIESRGFIFAAAIAQSLGAGFVPIRKPGKLPAPVHGADYALEYGLDRLEVHRDALAPGTRVLLVDDVLATGGTLRAARAVLERLGVNLCGASVLIELGFLGGREPWGSMPLRSVLRY